MLIERAGHEAASGGRRAPSTATPASSPAPSRARRSSRRAWRAPWSRRASSRRAPFIVMSPARVGEQQRLAAGEQEDVAVGSGHRRYDGAPRLAARTHVASIRRMDDADMPATRREVLDFWFGPRAARAARRVVPQGCRRSTTRSASASAPTSRRRSPAAFGEWCATPHGALARVLLLDQFTRNIFRDTPRAFAGDARALATADDAVDARLRPRARPLRALVPLHAVRAFRGRRRCRIARSRCSRALARRDGRRRRRSSGREKHAVVIRRFGRYPHRNAILGRASTPEEIAFLREPGSRF